VATKTAKKPASKAAAKTKKPATKKTVKAKAPEKAAVVETLAAPEIQKPKNRAENRLMLLQRMPKDGVVAEIGVWEGGFSELILDVTQPKELHLIDPWSYQPDYKNTAFGKGEDGEKMEAKYQMVVEKFKDDSRVTIHRKMSDDGLKSFPDAHFDWIYLDGNHNYDVVSKDLRLSARKVKNDGKIAGDDLLWKLKDGAPVRTAVKELKRKLGKSAVYTRMAQQYLFEMQRS